MHGNIIGKFIEVFLLYTKKKRSPKNISFSKNGGKFDQRQFLVIKCCIEIKYIVNVLLCLVAVALQLDINKQNKNMN